MWNRQVYMFFLFSLKSSSFRYSVACPPTVSSLAIKTQTAYLLLLPLPFVVAFAVAVGWWTITAPLRPFPGPYVRPSVRFVHSNNSQANPESCQATHLIRNRLKPIPVRAKSPAIPHKHISDIPPPSLSRHQSAKNPAYIIQNRGLEFLDQYFETWPNAIYIYMYI